MGKKRQRAHQVSKGIHHQKPSKWKKMARREWVGSTAQMNAKFDAWLKGKNVMLTIENPNKNETNKRFIRVNANEVWRRKTA
jgi:hypothetical protein